jgi:hypothetical protein
MNITELKVSVKTLIGLARPNGWGYECLTILRKMANRKQPENPVEWDQLPMQSVPYLDLKARLTGAQQLDAVESLLDMDTADASGAMLLSMSNEIFMPHVPEWHAARKPSADLLAQLSCYLFHAAPSEGYIGEAFRYRSRFGTTYTAIGEDLEFEMLFEAMPADGLDCAVGEGRWGLGRHWQSLGRFLARQKADWQALEQLENTVQGTELVSCDTPADEEAHDNLGDLIDAQRDRYIREALSQYDAQLVNLIESLLVELCESAAAQA